MRKGLIAWIAIATLIRTLDPARAPRPLRLRGSHRSKVARLAASRRPRRAQERNHGGHGQFEERGDLLDRTQVPRSKQRKEETPSELLTSDLPPLALRGRGLASMPQHQALHQNIGKECHLAARDPNVPGILHVFHQPVISRDPLRPRMEMHIPLPRKPAPRPSADWPMQRHAVEQAERIGHQPGPPRNIRVGDRVAALDPIVARLELGRKAAQEPRAHRAVGIDDHEGVEALERA